MLGNFACFLSSADFFKISLFKKLFQEHAQSVSLDSDQDQRSVHPDLGPNYLQRFESGCFTQVLLIFLL